MRVNVKLVDLSSLLLLLSPCYKENFTAVKLRIFSLRQAGRNVYFLINLKDGNSYFDITDWFVLF